MPFRIYKFRTMRADAEKVGGQLTIGRDSRITRLGHILRKSKLDELPQLINVLLGEMSLVGPRPELSRYVSLYNARQRHVLSVRPGMTGLASIKFRNESDLLQGEDPEAFYIKSIMPSKLELNLIYIERQTLWFDFVLIFRTFYLILIPERAVYNHSVPFEP